MRPFLDTLLVVALSGCGLLAAPRPAPMLARPRAAPVDPATDAIEVTWIGHATVLLRMRDRWFLTDPVLGDRIARVYPRKVRAGIDPRDLPALDAVLVSHAHMDHLDPASLRRIDAPVVLTPPGAARFVDDEVVALDTWQAWTDGDVTITAVPSSHGDGRYGIDRWVERSHTGWVIEYDGLTVYFAGDTGYRAEIARAIDARFDVDVALIPVGPAGRWRWVERLRRHVHVTPPEALRLFDEVGAQWMVPIHWGTFFMDPGRERPVIERAIAAHPRGAAVRVLAIGESTTFLY